MPAIQIRGLTKRFGGHTAIEGLHLEIGSRERLAILGASGAGKSTLLRLIAGLETPDAGTISIDGREASKLPPHQRKLSLMSQDYPLYPQLSVRQNLEAALISLSLTKAQRNAQCDESLRWFRIEDLANRMPSQLSGGQCQRVAFAKAIVRRPNFLLLDEPLSQVDTLLRDELRELIQATVQHFDASLVLVTHDPLDALRMASRIAVLASGKIEQVDAPENVYHRPTNRSTAELLCLFGVNWLTSRSLGGSPNATQVQQISNQLVAGMSIGFRPEACTLVATPSGADVLAMPAVVEQVQCLGFAYLVTLSVQGTKMRCLLKDQPVAPAGQLFLSTPLSSLMYVHH